MNIANIVLPINESQPHYLYIVTKYFVNQEKYFYLILFHIRTLFFIGEFVLSAMEMTFFTFNIFVECLRYYY